MATYIGGEGTALRLLTKYYLIQRNPEINFKLLKNNVYFINSYKNDSWYHSGNYWGNDICRPSQVRRRQHRKSQVQGYPVRWAA